jgi:RND family efflux transporter MFP subunit
VDDDQLDEADEQLSPSAQPASADGPSWTVTIVVCLIIAGVAGGLAALTFLTEPTATREGATKKTPMLVKVTSVERADHTPTIVATGTVQAERDVELRPQVAGRVVRIADNFKPGGFVKKGEVVAQLEQADFRHVLTQQRSALSDAEAALTLEMGQQDVAKSEFSFVQQEGDLTEAQRELILREPQLKAARERVEAARAAVEQAELDLRRTTIRAPFDAHVLRRDANVGSQVSTADVLGRLVGTDAYWVAIDVPLSKLRWIAMPEGDDSAGAEVTLRNRTAWPDGTVRKARIDSLVGSVDGQTRMARLLAVVDDPLAREAADGPALMVGEFLEVSIEGKKLSDVVRLPSDLVRSKNTVWVMNDGKLDIRDVEVVMSDGAWSYIGEGLETGDEVVTTDLASVRDGAPLRTSGESAEKKGEKPDTDENSGEESK